MVMLGWFFDRMMLSFDSRFISSLFTASRALMSEEEEESSSRGGSFRTKRGVFRRRFTARWRMGSGMMPVE